MTSVRQIMANRANARASTGPRSVLGKARASRNARRHGLSISIRLQPALSDEAECLAREIAGEGAPIAVLECARRIAEAQIDVARIRSARHGMFELRNRPKGLNKFIAILSEISETCVTMDRYERRALSRRKFAIRDFDAARRQWETNKEDTMTST